MSVEMGKPFRYAIGILKVMGIWMGKAPSKAYLVYGIIIHLTFIDLGLFLQVAYLFAFETIQDLINLMSLLPTFMGIFLKTLNIMTKFYQIEKLFDMTEKLLVQCSDTSRVTTRLKVVDKVFKVNLFFAVLSCVIGAISSIHEMPYKMWFPYDTENNRLGYWISAAYQSIITNCLATVTISIDMYPVFFLCYAIGFSEILCDRLKNLKRQEVLEVKSGITKQHESINEATAEQMGNYEEFLKCIHFQMEIDEYLYQINKVFSILWFIQGFISTLILCASAVTLTIVSLSMST